MKKNLLSIVILALLIVNIVLTAIMMFSVVGASKKTAKLVTDISSVLSLEVGTTEEASAEGTTVSIEDTQVYDIADEMTIPLKASGDGISHYALIKVSLSLNTKNEDYEVYGETVGGKESLLKSIIIDVVSSYTLEEAETDPGMMKKDILAKIQELYGSDFIFDVSFSNVIFQ